MKDKAHFVIVVALVLAFVVVLPAAADDDPWEGGFDPPGGGGPDGDASDFNGYLHWSLSTRDFDDPDSEFDRCWEMVAVVSDVPPEPHQEYEPNYDRLYDTYDGSGVVGDACPDEEVIDPEVLAWQLWVQLGPSNLDSIDVPPGHGLTGMPAYVVLDGDTERSRSSTHELTGTTISISATPTYSIDFGDGSEPVVTSSQGEPYPASGANALTHTYTDKGDYTIEVTTRWDAVFSAPGIENAPLEPRWTVDTYDLEVREYRSVRLGG